MWGIIFALKIMQNPNLETVFKSKFENFKIIPIFNQQQMSTYILVSREELRDGVGDIFALKMMQNPNVETVFKSEQI